MRRHVGHRDRGTGVREESKGPLGVILGLLKGFAHILIIHKMCCFF